MQGLHHLVPCASGRSWTCLNFRQVTSDQQFSATIIFFCDEVVHRSYTSNPNTKFSGFAQEGKVELPRHSQGNREHPMVGVCFSFIRSIRLFLSFTYPKIFTWESLYHPWTDSRSKCLYGCRVRCLSTGLIACQERFTANPELSPKFFPLAIPRSYICLLSDSERCPYLLPSHWYGVLGSSLRQETWECLRWAEVLSLFRFQEFFSFQGAGGYCPRSELAFVEPV